MKAFDKFNACHASRFCWLKRARALHAPTGCVRRQSNAERESGMDKVGHVAQQD